MRSAWSAVVWAVVWLLLTSGLVAAQPGGKAGSPTEAAASDLATQTEVVAGFVRKHCLMCHGEKEPMASIQLHRGLDAAGLAQQRKTWLRAVQMVEMRHMPPEEQPQPTEAESRAFVAAVPALLAEHDRRAPPDPGQVTMRRLNRAEYNRTVRDLLGIDFNPAEDFPSDGVGHGFDNIGDVLSMSPVQMERYLAAAEAIAQRALVPNPPKPPERNLSSQYLEPAGRDVPKERFRPISTAANPVALHTGPLFTSYNLDPEGEYLFSIRCYAENEKKTPVRIAVLACGKNLADAASDEQAAQLSGLAVPSLRPFVILETQEVTATSADASQVVQVRVPPKPGIQRIAVALLKPADGAPPNRLCVENFFLRGPLDTRPASHRRIMQADASLPHAEQTRQIITRLCRRAYRRPPTEDEVRRLAALVESCEARGDSWEAGVQLALVAVLASPKFLFRPETDTRPLAGNGLVPLDEHQLASRLSYFLWSSMPDEELFRLADEGRLSQQLPEQVRRMLADAKSSSLVEQFVLQWLQLGRLQSVSPDPVQFPAFNETLRSSMRRETELFVEAVFREERSLLELLDADFTFLNRALARHYGILDTAGNRSGDKIKRPGGKPFTNDQVFERVQLADGRRGGLLTQASVLTVTSNPTRTSPVKRGRWVLEQLLGTPPPPPPPNVPELDRADGAQLTGTLRQRMEQHRADPRCANCHASMDPLGFALENYDAIGAFRTEDAGQPIDASGKLPSGETFQGAVELKQILSGQREQFARALSERLLIFALGRGLEYYDQRAVDQISRKLAAGDYKLAALATAIVESEPFRFRRGKAGSPP